jgi:RNA polymerase sigma-70 factor (sigma-E family)
MPDATRTGACPDPSPVGEAWAFSEYVQARSPVLLRAARSLTHNPADAEDLLQTALAKTYQAWDRIDDKRAVEGYVRRVLVNTRTSQWRRRRVEEFTTDEIPEVLDPDPDATERLALRDAMWRAVRTLPPRQQAMLVLRYYEDLTEVQTAEIMGTSVGTVKSAVSRALAKLRLDASLRPGFEPPLGHAPDEDCDDTCGRVPGLDRAAC